MIYNVQSLRAVAAIMIIFAHLDVLLRPLGILPFAFGGVDLFFVASGFIMYFTTAARPVGPLAFFKNRIGRVAPIYWLLTLVVFGISTLVPHLQQSPDDSLAHLAKSLLFVPYKRPNGMVEPDLFVGWTLNYEMFFYALFALCLTAKHYLHGLAALVAILIGLTVVGVLFPSPDIVFSFYTSPIVLEFGLGIGVGILVTRMPPRAPLFTVVAVALATLVCLVMIGLATFVWHGVPSVITCGLPVAFVLFAAVTLERWGYVIKSRLMIAVGNASYSIYLTHPFVTQLFQKLAAHLHAGAGLSAGLIILSLISVCSFGYGFHRAVERPLTRYARRLLGARRVNPNPATPL